MMMCPYHRLMYVGHGEVALPSLLVDLVEATVGHGGVARVTTTATTAAVVLAVVATVVAASVAVVVLVPVVAVGRLGRRGKLWLRSRRRSVGVERRRSSGRANGVQVDLLQKKAITNFKKVREQRGAPDDGPEVLEALVEAAKDVEDEDPVVDGRP
jgi:hypothetical protein